MWVFWLGAEGCWPASAKESLFLREPVDATFAHLALHSLANVSVEVWDTVVFCTVEEIRISNRTAFYYNSTIINCTPNPVPSISAPVLASFESFAPTVEGSAATCSSLQV